MSSRSITLCAPVHIASTIASVINLGYSSTASIEASLPILPDPSLPNRPTRGAELDHTRLPSNFHTLQVLRSSYRRHHEGLFCSPATTVSIDVSLGTVETGSLACRPASRRVRPATERLASPNAPAPVALVPVC